MTETTTNHLYAPIIEFAQNEARELKVLLPPLPSVEELEAITGKMWAIDRPLIDSVRRHLDDWGAAPGHAYDEHLEWVASNAAYVAIMECNERGVMGELREEIIQRTWRLGLLHDLQRWRGYGKEHQIEGMKATRQKLLELGVYDDYLPQQVLDHDEMVVSPHNDPRFDIPFFSVFAVDHLNWGREWERKHWENLAQKGIEVSVGIHDYGFMKRLAASPNLNQTRWGQEVALPYINFGITIAESVESQFSTAVEEE